MSNGEHDRFTERSGFTLIEEETIMSQTKPATQRAKAKAYKRTKPAVTQTGNGQKTQSSAQLGMDSKGQRRQRLKKLASKMRYCGRRIPADPLPEGFFLVHNQGAPCDGGFFGFRAWVQEGRSDLVRCHCDFGGTLQKVDGTPLRKAEVPKHYRIRDSVLRKAGRLAVS